MSEIDMWVVIGTEKNNRGKRPGKGWHIGVREWSAVSEWANRMGDRGSKSKGT